MQQHQNKQQPTKQQVREWLRDLIAAHEPPPAPQVVQDQLWNNADSLRRQVLS